MAQVYAHPELPDFQTAPLPELSPFRTVTLVRLLPREQIACYSKFVWADGLKGRGRGHIKDTITVTIRALGAKRSHPLRLFSVSYSFPTPCHGRGRAFEPYLKTRKVIGQ